LRLIAEAEERGRVYVHCWGGVGRTGTVVGCLLLDRGLATGDDVLYRLAELRAGTRKGRRPSPETPAQIEVLRRRARSSTAGRSGRPAPGRPRSGQQLGAAVGEGLGEHPAVGGPRLRARPT